MAGAGKRKGGRSFSVALCSAYASVSVENQKCFIAYALSAPVLRYCSYTKVFCHGKRWLFQYTMVLIWKYAVAPTF